MTTDTEGLIERIAEAIIRGRYEMVERGDWPVEHARTFGTYVWRDAKQDARSAIAALQQPDERDAQIARLREDAFNSGYLLAVAAIVHLHDQPVIAEDVLAELGVTEGIIKRLDLTDYDAKPLRKLFREIKERERRARRYRAKEDHNHDY